MVRGGVKPWKRWIPPVGHPDVDWVNRLPRLNGRREIRMHPLLLFGWRIFLAYCAAKNALRGKAFVSVGLCLRDFDDRQTSIVSRGIGNFSAREIPQTQAITESSARHDVAMSAGNQRFEFPHRNVICWDPEKHPELPNRAMWHWWLTGILRGSRLLTIG